MRHFGGQRIGRSIGLRIGREQSVVPKQRRERQHPESRCARCEKLPAGKIDIHGYSRVINSSKFMSVRATLIQAATSAIASEEGANSPTSFLAAASSRSANSWDAE